MKYIIIGLGYFGSKLASVLTTQGHEVLAIDNKAERLEEVKDSVTTVMKMDTTSINAVNTLPLGDTDAVIVAIGADVGASILTLSILKKLNARRIIGRATNQIHQNILTQIGIEEVVLPLEESAHHVASILQARNVLRLVEISDEHAVAEIMVPEKYTGHQLDTINIGDRFDLKVIAIKHAPPESFPASIFRRGYRTDIFYSPDVSLKNRDILILAGKITDIKRFSES
jgi:trk system potassium uptake protein TrkA